VFHLLPSGQAVLGEPPLREVPKAKASATRERATIDPAEVFEGVGSKLAKIKLPDAKTLGVVAIVLLVVAAGYWLFSRESIETRSARIGTAIGKGDVQTIVDLSLPGTEIEAMKWAYDVVRQFGELKLSLGGQEPGMKVQVQQDTQGSAAHALVVFSAEGGRRGGTIPQVDLQAPNPANANKSVEMVLYWSPDIWGAWRLDAKRTLEAGKSAG
jgi:hypothetical protein